MKTLSQPIWNTTKKLVKNPNANNWFSCFADSPSSPGWGETLKALIFPLKNSEGLPPFQCVATGEDRAIYKYSLYATVF